MSDQAKEETLESISSGLLPLLLVTVLAGILVGLIGGSFHWLLEASSNGFTSLLASLSSLGLGTGTTIALAFLAGALCVGLARWLVRNTPSARGSGIQHVEAVMHGKTSPAPFRVLPLKFAGGILSMMPGLALGREGPTVQMAAVIGTECGRLFRLGQDDKSLLYTAIAGSGLSVAFNAPLAGAVFVLEEVSRLITFRRLLVSLLAVASAITTYRMFFGNITSFDVGDLLPFKTPELLLFALLGAWLGALGVLYNRSTIFALDVSERVAPTWRPEWKAALVGGIVGILALLVPQWIGGGEKQVQWILNTEVGLNSLVVLLLVRWILGPVSYATGTPGGLFAPLLLIGAASGACFSTLVQLLISTPLELDSSSYAIVGMAAFFTAVVRAPLTGVLLMIEMTGSVSLVAPLLVASVASAAVATLMRGEPIYDTLRARMPPER